MFFPNGQTVKDEHERRIALVCTWVERFPRKGKTEKQLDQHIRDQFGVNRVTSHSYRRLARERLGAALLRPEDLVGLLLEWGETAWEEVETARLGVKERVKLRALIIATLARLCPRHVVTVPGTGEAPPFSFEEQQRFLAGGGPDGAAGEN
jgi:hypothetical protein